jgi:uncharacterized protein
MTNERSGLPWLIGGSFLALILSPLIVILTGNESYYTLILFPLILLLWFFTRFSKILMGIRWGNGPAYALAILYPLFVMGLTGLIVWGSAGIQAENIPLTRIATNLAIMFLMTLLFALITEESFFRGWLWGMLEHRGTNLWLILILTGGLFSVWHFAINFVMPNMNIASSVVPVYLGNLFLLGINFGLLRKASGSIIVPSVSHALWNALLYNLYGLGDNNGALAVSSYQLFDPERGILGLALNIISAGFLWLFINKKQSVKIIEQVNTV